MLVQLRVIGIIRFPVRSTYIELNEPSSNMGVIFQAAKIVTEIYISFRDTGDFSSVMPAPLFICPENLPITH